MPEPLYRPVDPKVSFPQMEEALVASWKERDVFHRQLEMRKGAPEWVFYEGPPTANNKPHIGHVESRTFKDIFPRFHAMRGKYVYRKAGWDCHGLPVEVEVEKELGINHKRQIEEEIGIEEFVARCKASVQRYVADWEKLTNRIAFWIDLDDAYWTMTPDYVESVWWILKQIWDKGLLEEDFKTVPYCPRCETALSSHEQHMVGAYQTVKDPSVYVRFPLVDDSNVALLVWTTTPWTLLSNFAVAAGEDITYAEVDDPSRPDKRLILAKERVEPLLGEGTKVLRTLTGAELIDTRYVPPFDFVRAGGPATHTVRPGDFVTTEDGSGMVHLAPYGEEDMMVGKRDDLPIVQMIDGSGNVVASGEKFAGLWIKDADKAIIDDLTERQLLFRSEIYEHAYPHCWRCGTPLLYYARKDWYIRTSQIRSQLEASNEETNWQPPTIKYGRFGDWLANNVDWSLSRDRYWGTPLPIWRCEQGHATCVGSFAELGERAGRDLGADFDPHRPFVDEVTFPCPECQQEATRVTSVIDAWFDSGSMPFAQWHYPFENTDVFETRFPANFISEAIDQTRGWFYSLTAVATLVRGQNSYRNVVCLGLIMDAEGRKMSKSLGNVLDPWTVINAHGADALRWYMLTSGTPWSPRRIGPELIEESLRKFLLTLWNTYSFWVTYAALESFDPSTVDIPVADRPETDRWILAELDDTMRIVTESLEAFDATRGGKRLDRFVDDLSNWYVRRSRRRFWRSGADADTQAAFLTLWECLTTVTQLCAPYTPFISDEIYSNLVRPLADAADSVHLSDWPEPVDARRDDALRRRMGLVRKLVGLGRAARTEAKVRVRQPLARAYVVIPQSDMSDFTDEQARLVEEELNVKSIVIAPNVGDFVDYEVKANFKRLGPRFGKDMKGIAAAIARQDPESLVMEAHNLGKATIQTKHGATIELEADDLDIRIQPKGHRSFAAEGHLAVIIDLDLTDELQQEGVVRDVVRWYQDLRKSAGLAVEDRIIAAWRSKEQLINHALDAHRSYIASEILATELRKDTVLPDAATSQNYQFDFGTVMLSLKKA